MFRPKIARDVHDLEQRKLRKRKLRGRKLRGHGVPLFLIGSLLSTLTLKKLTY